jgi:UDP-2,3-diacylglucosamine pyrophosphatase LpxH
VTAGGDDLRGAERERGPVGLAGFVRSGASLASTVPFEQIGQSAVKRLCRQKSEVTRLLRGYALANMRSVRTAVLSDLHLGTRSRADVLRYAPIRRILFEALEGVDEVVLLGDVLELREQPLPVVFEVALPFFDELGEALPDARITILSGNHDHRLVAEWLDERRLQNQPLALEQRTAASDWRPLSLIAERMPRNEVEVAYPGTWLRPGTYATHGHYLDLHMSIPRVEVIAVRATARANGGLAPAPRTPVDYEAAVTPLYAFAYALAQGTPRARRVLGMDLSRKVWARIDGSPGLSNRALRGMAIPSAVWALNRAGVGPFEAKITGTSLRESGLAAMVELIEALAIDAREVVFGHTHRPGPLPQDTGWDPRLINTGSWLYEPNLLDPNEAASPYWPGTVLFVEDDKPAELRRLLRDVSHEELGSHVAYS